MPTSLLMVSSGKQDWVDIINMLDFFIQLYIVLSQGTYTTCIILSAPYPVMKQNKSAKVQMSLTPGQKTTNLRMFKDLVPGKLLCPYAAHGINYSCTYFLLTLQRIARPILHSCKLVYILSHLSTFAFDNFFLLLFFQI